MKGTFPVPGGRKAFLSRETGDLKPKKKKTETNKKTQNLKWPINIDIIQLKFKNRYVDESKKKAGIKLSQAIELYTVPTAAYKCSPEFSARAASLHNFCGCQSQN